LFILDNLKSILFIIFKFIAIRLFFTL